VTRFPPNLQRDARDFWIGFAARHWLGSDTAGGIELSQAKTRVICTVIGLGGFLVMGRFASLPDGIVGAAIVFPLYALPIWCSLTSVPHRRHARRGFALLNGQPRGDHHRVLRGQFSPAT